jgi:hypothetical protein
MRKSFFLPAIPAWINFSEAGGCFKQENVDYFKFDLLSKYYQLTYDEAVHVQALYFEEVSKRLPVDLKMRVIPTGFLSPQEKMMTFFDIVDKVKAGIKSTQNPEFPKINILWIDGLKSSSEVIKWLTKYSASNLSLDGYPIIFSFCLSRMKGYEFLTKEKLESEFPVFLGPEYLSIYAADGNQLPLMHLNFARFFDVQNVTIVTPPGVVLPKNFQGYQRTVVFP